MALANIKDNIVAALALINGSAPYTVAVARVNTRLINNHRTSGSNLPALEVLSEVVDHGDPVDIDQAMPRATFIITGWVQVTKDSDGNPGDPDDDLLPLFEDTKRALRVDETRGGYAKAFYLTTTNFMHGEDEAAFTMRAIAVYAE